MATQVDHSTAENIQSRHQSTADDISRPAYGDAAMHDLIAFIGIAKDNPDAAAVFNRHVKESIPWIVGDDQIDPATGAWNGVVKLVLCDDMARFLPAKAGAAH